jgi:hypothetical protein
MAETNAQAGTVEPAKRDEADYDLFTHRLVVIFLGLTVLFTGLNLTVLELYGHQTPSALVNLGSVAIGALAMCLAHRTRGS